ncbi:MAG: TrkA family potassium uptake protein [Acholeplasmatales bacterium]|nr:TrkA family potassium uptake protein [Acholeplasmatales bacterium]
MKKTFMVIGLGRFGSNVAKTLVRMNCDVLALDINEDSVSAISNEVRHCVIADATKLNVLKELGAETIDHVVIAIGNNLQASILTIMNLKRLGVKNITVRADEEGHCEVYKALGATDIIIPEESAAVSLSNQIISDTILDYYEVAGDYAMVKMEVGKDFTENLIELNVRNRFDINIVGVINNNEFFIPRGTDCLKKKEIVVVVGTKQRIKKFDEFLND